MASTPLATRQIVAISVAGGLAFIAIVAWVFSLVLTGSTANPFAGKTLYVNPDSTAAQAASSASGDDATTFASIAAVPTATWLLPEQHATADIAAYVDSVADAADTQSAVPIFTVYGIPNRDCSNESAGGTTTEDYPNWVSAIANGLSGHEAVVILEPDSLGLSVSCGDGDQRVAEIATAIEKLQTNGTKNVAIYLDGGHSTWVGAEVQADLLNRAGVSKVRGFATNVSNFNATADEVTYAETVSSLTGDSHYVIDTGRNGNGTNGVWCNPDGRKLGDTPTAIDDGTAHDANLWIKNPGESDGSCNGGPAAGTWWAAGALALAAG